jgi:hypothetical protein
MLIPDLVLDGNYATIRCYFDDVCTANQAELLGPEWHGAKDFTTSFDSSCSSIDSFMSDSATGGGCVVDPFVVDKNEGGLARTVAVMLEGRYGDGLLVAHGIRSDANARVASRLPRGWYATERNAAAAMCRSPPDQNLSSNASIADVLSAGTHVGQVKEPRRVAGPSQPRVRIRCPSPRTGMYDNP